MIKLLQNLLAGESKKESVSETSAIQPISPDSLESQITQADSLWQKGKLGEAIVIYRQAIEHNPESTEIYEHLSTLLKQQGNIAEAYEKLAAGLKDRGNIEQAASYYRQAIGLKALTGDTKQKLLKSKLVRWQKKSTALAELKNTAFSFQPLSYSSLTTHHNLHNLGLENNSDYFARVRKISREQAIKIDWEAAQVYLQQALDLCEQQEWESASHACQQAIAIQPNMAEAYKILGNALQRMGKTAEAMNCYAKAVEIKPDLAEVYAGIGDLYSKQRRWEEAIKYYQKATIIKPSAQIYRSAASVWQQLGQFEKAKINTYRALELESAGLSTSEKTPEEPILHNQFEQKAISNNLSNDSLKIYHQIAQKLERQNRWQEAAMYYRKALEASLSQPVLSVKTDGERQLASSSKSQGSQKLLQGKNSEVTHQNNISDDKTDNALNLNSTEFKERQIDKAIRRYYKQAELEPNSAQVHSNLGNLYAKKRQWKSAITCYRQAIKIDPQCAEAHLNLARSLAKIGNQAEFITEMKRALCLQSDIASAIDRFYLGNALLKQGRKDEAIGSYYKATIIDPHFVQAYHRLGEVLSQQGKYQTALEFYQTAIDYNPEDAELYYALGKQLTIQQDWNAAVKAYTKVLQLNPRFPNASKELNYALAEKLKLRLDLANKHQ